jgi:nucleoside-diphosphate-sugar epimerase
VKVTVFGANGPTGRLLVGQLLDAGHSVVAVTRHPESFPVTEHRVRVIGADVFHRPSVLRAVDGADAVCSALGVPFTRQPVDTFLSGTSNIVSAMRDKQIRRLVVVSSTGAHHYRNRRNASLTLRIVEPLISRTTGKPCMATCATPSPRFGGPSNVRCQRHAAPGTKHCAINDARLAALEAVVGRSGHA